MILNIGSLNLDKTYRVEHLTAAGETQRALSYREYCGGKGLNQSMALARAGADVAHCGAVGADGGKLLALLHGAGVDISAVTRLDMASGHAVIQVDDRGQNNIIIYAGANEALTRRQIDQALERLQTGDWVLLQNETNEIAYIIEAAYSRGLKTAFNPSPINARLAECDLTKVDMLLVNEIEGAALAPVPGLRTADEIRGGLRRAYPSLSFVLTLGSSGAWYDTPSGAWFHDIYPVKAEDTTGAGDTFTGYFLAGVMENRAPETCLDMACAASAISVTRAGASASIPTREEVERLIAGSSEVGI